MSMNRRNVPRRRSETWRRGETGRRSKAGWGHVHTGHAGRRCERLGCLTPVSVNRQFSPFIRESDSTTSLTLLGEQIDPFLVLQVHQIQVQERAVCEKGGRRSESQFLNCSFERFALLNRCTFECRVQRVYSRARECRRVVGKREKRRLDSLPMISDRRQQVEDSPVKD